MAIVREGTGAAPNFLLFITDQHRADHLGLYGNEVVRTPNLDALGARSWVADHFFVASPVCMPNRASLMTGRMPSANGVRANGIPLSKRATTFVELLRAGGYRTGLVGKAHLENMTGKPPLWPAAGERRARDAWSPEPGRYDDEWGPRWQTAEEVEVQLPFYGFEHVDFAIDHGDTAGGHYRQWLEREHPEVAAQTGQSHAQPTDYVLAQSKQAWRTRVPETLSTTSWIADRAIDLLQRWAKPGQAKEANDAGKPFFIQCSFPDPHHPFTPPGRYWDMYAPGDMRLPTSFGHTGPLPPHVAWLHAQRDAGRAVKHTPAVFACDEREAREALALNYGSITHIDDAIGRVLQALEHQGLADNTVVVFTSDHGDFLGDHQLLFKGPLHYNGIVQVPFVWHDPARPRAARGQALCSTIDLAPTFLARAGIEPFHGIQGHSLLPLIEGSAVMPLREAVLIEEETQRTMFGFADRIRVRTLRSPTWRLSLYDGADWGELYDLVSDPDECDNLWFEPSKAPYRAALTEALARQMLAHADASPYPGASA